MRNKSLPSCQTTSFEHFLLITMIVLLPLENHIPAIAGVSIMFIIFSFVASYVLLFKPQALRKILLHPICIAIYMIMAVGALIEFFHPHSDFTRILRFGFMIAGAAMVASLCRDRSALRAGMLGYLISGLWVGGLLIFTSYSSLYGASAGNFSEAGQIRLQTFMDAPLFANLNALSIICAQSTFIAITLALSEKSLFRRNVFFALSSLCLIATFLPMSRSGVLALMLFFVLLMWKFGVRAKTLIVAIFLGISILMFVPEVIVSRLTISTETRPGKRDARLHFYQLGLKHLPEYIMTGVGAGNFWGSWGKRTGYYKKTYGIVYGPHNCYILVTIYWGVFALLLYLNLIYQAYSCLPYQQSRKDHLALCMLFIAISLLLMTLLTHRIAGKEFSLGLGLFMGSQTWIWTKQRTRPHRQKTVGSPIMFII